MAEGFVVRCVASRRTRISLQDTHTWALFFRKTALALEEGIWVLEHPGGLLQDLQTPAGARFGEDFHDERMRDFLDGAIGYRALREVAKAGLRREAHEILDATGKIVARLEVTRLEEPAGGVFATLQPLLGYESEAIGILAALRDSGCETATESLVEAVCRLCDIQPVAYSSKPRLTASPQSTAAEAVMEILTSLLEIARWNEFGIVGDVDSEFLHDFRVALRKLRSVLSLTKGVFTEEATLRWKRQIGDVCRKTNALRDMDVQLLTRERLCAMLPEELRHGLDTFFEESSKTRAVHARKVSALLSSKSYTALVSGLPQEWQDATHHGPSATLAIGAMAAERLRKRFRRIRKLQKSIAPSTPDAAIHSLRIECKKMRYLLDSFGGLFPADLVEPLAKDLARVQNRLGRYNDTSVQQDHFLKRAQACLDSGDCSLALSLGGLIGSLHHEHAALRERVVESLEAFCDRDHRDLVTRIARSLP
jgi:CHAD domain-containing protein